MDNNKRPMEHRTFVFSLGYGGVICHRSGSLRLSLAKP